MNEQKYSTYTYIFDFATFLIHDTLRVSISRFLAELLCDIQYRNNGATMYNYV
jgi:hypothetical protein